MTLGERFARYVANSVARIEVQDYWTVPFYLWVRSDNYSKLIRNICWFRTTCVFLFDDHIVSIFDRRRFKSCHAFVEFLYCRTE